MSISKNIAELRNKHQLAEEGGGKDRLEQQQFGGRCGSLDRERCVAQIGTDVPVVVVGGDPDVARARQRIAHAISEEETGVGELGRDRLPGPVGPAPRQLEVD